MTPVKIQGVYYAFWTCVQGYCEAHREPARHKVSLRTSDKREAAARCADLDKRLETERARNALGLKPPIQSNMTLAEYVESYQAAVKHDKGETTRKTEACHLRSLVKFAGKDRPLKDLTQDVLEKYRGHRLADIAPRSWNSELATLKAIFSWGLTRYPPLYDVNPFASIQRVDKGRPTIDKYVAPDQVDASMHGEPFWVNALDFLRVTWCRGGELRGLKWADVDYSMGCLTFTHTKESRNKTLPLTSAVLQILQRAKALRPGSVYVFPDKDGSQLDKDQLYNGIKRLGATARVKLSPHRLRHSGITNALRRGANLFAVQSVAGHSQVTTTRDYAHTALEDKQRAMESLTPPMMQSEAGKLLKDETPKPDVSCY